MAERLDLVAALTGDRLGSFEDLIDVEAFGHEGSFEE
jgi:hypothetical protein